MNNFFDRFKPGGGKPGKGSGSNSSGGTNNNPLAGLFGGSGTTSFSGTGQSLGGNVKPGTVISITLSEAGPLGIKIERSSTNTAIVSMVVPNTQADAAGIQRGDILCFAGTNGTEEINYEMFLELARSDQRPLCFELRRIVAPSTSKRKSAAASSSINGTNINASTELSAEAFARKQAMIAAAEKREKDHQKKYSSTNNSSSKSSTSKPALKQILSTAEKNRLEQERQQRLVEQQISSEANHSEFVQKAKHLEQQTASQLGYNPYVTQSVSAGLARNVVTSTTHGTIQTASSSSSNTNTTAPASASSSNPAPGIVASPMSLPVAAEAATTNQQRPRPSVEFQQAFEMTVTSTPDHAAVINSITILRKLIINATTKGQSSNEDNDKYRKIRFMTNPKIRASVTDIPGAIDLLLSIGFQIHEDIVLRDEANQNDGNTNDTNTESVLLYPPATQGPIWLPTALQQMEQYIQQQ